MSDSEMISVEMVKRLKTSPIFNMSLGSKELFHSNFLAWLTENYPSEMANLFTDLINTYLINQSEPSEPILPYEVEEGVRVKREERNIDLAITFDDDRRIIIENKVKSVPYPEQLNRYKETEEKHNVKQKYTNKYILLTINKPTFDLGRCPDWLALTYKELAVNLKELKLTKNPYHEALLKDYIHLIESLDEIMDLFKFGDGLSKLFLLGEKDTATLKDLRLYDMVAKYRAAQVEERIREVFSYEKTKIYSGADVHISKREVKGSLGTYHGFSRGKSFVGFNCIYSSLPKVALGILVENNRLCWAVEMGTEDKCKDSYEQLVVEDCLWTKASLGIEEVGKEKLYDSAPNLQSGKKYRKYGGFLYDYVIINKHATLQDIINAIEKGANTAIGLSGKQSI